MAKATCDFDARVTYAVLTEAGHERLRGASRTHLADIAGTLGVLEPDELEVLGSLPERLEAAAEPAPVPAA